VEIRFQQWAVARVSAADVANWNHDYDSRPTGSEIAIADAAAGVPAAADIVVDVVAVAAAFVQILPVHIPDSAVFSGRLQTLAVFGLPGILLNTTIAALQGQP
jgi:hypothetical protein